MSAPAPERAPVEGVDVDAVVPCHRWQRNGVPYCPEGTPATHRFVIDCDGHRYTSPCCAECGTGVLSSTNSRKAPPPVPVLSQCGICGAMRWREDLSMGPL